MGIEIIFCIQWFILFLRILKSGKTQKTDIHYLAFGGEGAFNWRFVFPFEFDPIEKKIIYQKKASCQQFLLWKEVLFTQSFFFNSGPLLQS